MYSQSTRRGCTIFKLSASNRLQLSIAGQRRRVRLLRTLSVSICALILTSTALAASKSSRIELKIKPKVCVLNNEDEACLDELNISWLSEDRRNLCLYQKSHNEPLACWENAKKGSHSMALNTNTSLNFLLRESQQNELLASETFEVIHDHKQYRRARRNAWAFF